MTVRNMAWGLVAAGVIAATARWPSRRTRSACCSPTTNDMPVAGGNLGNQRYSTLTSINRQNIHNLGAAWRTDVSAVAPATTHVGTQTTPVVVGGVIFLDTPAGGVIAVDGKTGASRWKWAGAAPDPTPPPVEAAGVAGRGRRGGAAAVAAEAAPGGRGERSGDPAERGEAAPGGRGAAAPAVVARRPRGAARMRATRRSETIGHQSPWRVGGRRQGVRGGE